MTNDYKRKSVELLTIIISNSFHSSLRNDVLRFFETLNNYKISFEQMTVNIFFPIKILLFKSDYNII